MQIRLRDVPPTSLKDVVIVLVVLMVLCLVYWLAPEGK